jgi:hypothetical protein
MAGEVSGVSNKKSDEKSQSRSRVSAWCLHKKIGRFTSDFRACDLLLDAMNSSFKFGGTKALLMLSCVLCLFAASAGAQTSSGQLTITMSVQSSITLVFQNNPSVGTTGFCPLTNAGTNNVGLDMGIAAFPGSFHTSTCVNYQHITASFYEVSSAFDVVVSKANSSSPNYRLAAQISTPPPVGVVWLLNNVTLTNTGFTQLDAADAFGQRITKTLQVQVRNNVPTQTLLETITFLATAN